VSTNGPSSHASFASVGSSEVPGPHQISVYRGFPKSLPLGVSSQSPPFGDSSKSSLGILRNLLRWGIPPNPPKCTSPDSIFPTVPVHSVPNSGASAVERINSFELKKYFGSRGLSDWTTLEHTGSGIHDIQDKDAPTTLGDITTITRNNQGKLLQRPSHTLHTLGMDIGYGEGTSPGGYNYALTLVDYATRYTWTYGLKTKTVESIIDALWSFFVDAGGMPRRIRCDFDSSFVKEKIYEFIKQHQIQITSAPPSRQSQNGLVQRQWRTAVAMARSMLIEACLPRRYWFWALHESVIRMNMIPCKPTAKPADRPSARPPVRPSDIASSSELPPTPATPSPPEVSPPSRRHPPPLFRCPRLSSLFPLPRTFRTAATPP
jgi:hypothetical protein